MNKKPKAVSVSIVIPVFNEQDYLETCLKSIKNQSIHADELIVVDNNSTDNSAKIAEKFDFVRIVKEKKQGIVYARNRGFNEVKSDIIARIDADTILPKNWVKSIKDFYSDSANQNVGLTGGCYFYNLNLPQFWGWLQSQIAFRANRWILGHYIFYGSNMALPVVVWKKVRNQTCKDIDIHEDLDLAIHAHRNNYPITYHAGLKVGVSVKRVQFSDSAISLYEYLMWWPNTLRKHGLNGWVFGWLGAIILLIFLPIGFIIEGSAWAAKKLLRRV